MWSRNEEATNYQQLSLNDHCDSEDHKQSLNDTSAPQSAGILTAKQLRDLRATGENGCSFEFSAPGSSGLIVSVVEMNLRRGVLNESCIDYISVITKFNFGSDKDERCGWITKEDNHHFNTTHSLQLKLFSKTPLTQFFDNHILAMVATSYTELMPLSSLVLIILGLADLFVTWCIVLICCIRSALSKQNDSLQENRTALPCHIWDYDIADKRDSIVSLFDLVCERRRRYDLSSLAYVVGYTFLAPVAGFVSDRVGRRPILLDAAATYASLVVTLIVAVSAGAATYIPTFILLHEVTGNAWRSLFTLLHTAMAATVVPPLLHAVSLLEPRWLLAQGLLLVPTAMSVTWCCLQEESPAWLLTTGNMRDAEVAILAAAQLNGVDVNKAKETLTVIMSQLGKMDRSQSSTTTVSAAEGIIETVKMRRRAVSVFLARFTLSALYFGVLVRDRATALRWHVAHVFLSTVFYAATYWAMTKWGLRDTLAALLAVVCSCAFAEAAVISRDYNPAVPFVHAGMKVAVSAALGVALCYVGDIFPTHIRSIGVSLSVCFGGAGTLSSVSLITLAGRNANAAFSMFAAFTTLLSIVVVHWLPEAFIEKPKKAPPIRAMTEMERKEELEKSLSFFAARKKGKSH
ncbi:hypothetical protein V5799_012767 [Amblyomma americanum]|uniref:Uncharacterized protein n=1 Tax=Amblyomma americanum TaxID=6943 RepID=A0AAQ4E815_AMBAM